MDVIKNIYEIQKSLTDSISVGKFVLRRLYINTVDYIYIEYNDKID